MCTKKTVRMRDSIVAGVDEVEMDATAQAGRAKRERRGQPVKLGSDVSAGDRVSSKIEGEKGGMNSPEKEMRADLACPPSHDLQSTTSRFVFHSPASLHIIGLLSTKNDQVFTPFTLEYLSLRSNVQSRRCIPTTCPGLRI